MEKESIYQLVKDIDFNIANFFFLEKEYQEFMEKYYKEKYPYKYEEKIEIDFEDIFEQNPFLINKKIGWDDVSNPSDNINDSDVNNDINIEISEYSWTPDYPDIGMFINLWYYDPEDNSSLDIDFFVNLKLNYIYNLLKELTIEQQKGIILLILRFIRKSIGSQDLIFLKAYFKCKFPNSWQDHYGDIRVYKKRAGSILFDDLIKYYCILLEGNVDKRVIITQKEYIGILGHLNIIERVKKYEIQAKSAIQLVNNHQIFTKFRLVTIKENTIFSYIKHYFSNPEKFNLNKELIDILDDLNKEL